jgi:hypothetical protein
VPFEMMTYEPTQARALRGVGRHHQSRRDSDVLFILDSRPPFPSPFEFSTPKTEKIFQVYLFVCKQNMSGNMLPAPSPAQDFLAKRRRGRRLERRSLITFACTRTNIINTCSPLE